MGEYQLFFILGGVGGSHSLHKDMFTSGTSSKVEPFLFIAHQRGNMCAFLTNVQLTLPGGCGQEY